MAVGGLPDAYWTSLWCWSLWQRDADRSRRDRLSSNGKCDVEVPLEWHQPPATPRVAAAVVATAAPTLGSDLTAMPAVPLQR